MACVMSTEGWGCWIGWGARLMSVEIIIELRSKMASLFVPAESLFGLPEQAHFRNGESSPPRDASSEEQQSTASCGLV